MSDLTKKQAWGVIDALPDPHASLLENYIEQLEAERDYYRSIVEDYVAVTGLDPSQALAKRKELDQ